MEPAAEHELPQGEHDETGVVIQVPEPQPSGFRDESEEPFQSQALHPQVGLGFLAGQKIKGRSHAHHDDGQLAPVLRHPLFLFGAAQANEQNPAPRKPDFREGGLFFFNRWRAERRRVEISDLQATIPFLHSPGEQCRRLFRSPIESHRDTLPGGGLANVQTQRRPIHPWLIQNPESSHHPNNGHAARGDQVGPVNHRPVLRRIVGLHHHRHRGLADISRFLLPGPPQNFRRCGSVIGRVNPHAQNAPRFTRFLASRAGGNPFRIRYFNFGRAGLQRQWQLLHD